MTLSVVWCGSQQASPANARNPALNAASPALPSTSRTIRKPPLSLRERPSREGWTMTLMDRSKIMSLADRDAESASPPERDEEKRDAGREDAAPVIRPAGAMSTATTPTGFGLPPSPPHPAPRGKGEYTAFEKVITGVPLAGSSSKEPAETVSL